MKKQTMTEQRAQKGIRERRPISSSPVPRPSSHFRGLTLVELVIVCGIIAMLAGILWVVMGPVREKARQTVCISNLTQIGHAFRMYRENRRRVCHWSIGNWGCLMRRRQSGCLNPT